VSGATTGEDRVKKACKLAKLGHRVVERSFSPCCRLVDLW
jgi:hypothetical protein